jgi:hypothetical protein
MSETLPQRPTFSNGQYIGADDLNAAVDYARDESERLALSGRTWGIATGLALVEIIDATGAIQMYIEPGIAWDGYGRAIVVITPAPVTVDMFAGLPSGNQKVWLKYRAADTQLVSPGFRTCGAGDPATRIAETHAIVTGAPSPTQRTDGVVLNAVNVPDPRNMLIAFDAAAAVVLDGSAPHQLFPADNSNWLVPVGIVNYVSGSAGSFGTRTLSQLMENRIVRRYIGTVAESVLAADGVLRLRDRQTDQQIDEHGNIVSNDTLEASASIQPSDIDSDPNNATRLIGNELVWVEGNLRVVGDARLFGGELNFRVSDGTEPAGSFFLRRNVDTTTKTTQNLEVSIGQPASGTGPVNRLLVAASQNGTLATPPALSVGADSRVGIGVAVPGTGLALDINGDFGHDGGPTTLHLNGATVAGDGSGNLLLTTSAANGTIELGADGVLTHVAIGTKSPQTDTALDVHGGGIAVNNQNAFLRLLGSALIDQDDGVLRIRSGGNIVTFDGADNVGIGTVAPSKLLDVNGDANVRGTLNAGQLIAGNASITESLILGGGITVTSTGAAFLALLGSRLSDNNDGILHIQSGGDLVKFDGVHNNMPNNVWIGGALIALGGVFPHPSDVRLKRDIRPLDGALDKLMALRGVEFEWARDDLARLRPGRQAGLIADEVEKVFPNWVRHDSASDMKLIGPQGFEALVVEALRQLTKRIEALEAENSRLSQMLAARTG